MGGSNHNVKMKDLQAMFREAGFESISGGRHAKWRSPDGVETFTASWGSGEVGAKTVHNARKAIDAYNERTLATNPPAAVSVAASMPAPMEPASTPVVPVDSYACVTGGVQFYGLNDARWPEMLAMCTAEGLWTTERDEARELAIIKWGLKSETGSQRRFTLLRRDASDCVWRVPVSTGHGDKADILVYDSRKTTVVVLTEKTPVKEINTNTGLLPARVCITGVTHPTAVTRVKSSTPPTPAVGRTMSIDTAEPKIKVEEPVPPSTTARLITELGLDNNALPDVVVERVRALRTRERRVADALREVISSPTETTPWEQVGELAEERDNAIRQLERMKKTVAIPQPMQTPPDLRPAIDEMMRQLNAPVVRAVRGTEVKEQDVMGIILEAGLRSFGLIP